MSNLKRGAILQDRPADAGLAQAGLSLVELMVAMTIGLLLLSGLVTMFASSSAREELDKSSRQIENGRFAMQVLQDEIHHAGYYGFLPKAPVLSSAVTSLPDPCSTVLTDVQNGLALPVQSYAGAAAASELDPGKLACLNAAAGYKPYTAVLVVRRAATSIKGFTAGMFNIQVSGCVGDPAFYVLDTVQSRFTLHQNSSPGCSPITSANPADITTYYSRIFFISTCSGTNCSAAGADSIPTLKRIDLTSTGTTITPIVDGIENLQFDYGLDNLAPYDGAPDTYTNTPEHTAAMPLFSEWPQVMALRVHLLARNTDSTPGYADPKTYSLGPVTYTPAQGSYKRHAYTELVRINNPAGRRE